MEKRIENLDFYDRHLSRIFLLFNDFDLCQALAELHGDSAQMLTMVQRQSYELNMFRD
jgi:hypothetical protein